jgi:hypothetical protein
LETVLVHLLDAGTDGRDLDYVCPLQVGVERRAVVVRQPMGTSSARSASKWSRARTHSSKLGELVEQLRAIGLTGKKDSPRVLVFSERIRTLHMLRDELARAFGVNPDGEVIATFDATTTAITCSTSTCRGRSSASSSAWGASTATGKRRHRTSPTFSR